MPMSLIINIFIDISRNRRPNARNSYQKSQKTAPKKHEMFIRMLRIKLSLTEITFNVFIWNFWIKKGNFRISFLSQIITNEAIGTYLPMHWLPLLKMTIGILIFDKVWQSHTRWPLSWKLSNVCLRLISNSKTALSYTVQWSILGFHGTVFNCHL